MKLDRLTFERSFFYIGPGYDIQPLLRFTHLCDTFLYPNLYLDRTAVERWYDSALAAADDIEVLNKRVTRGFDSKVALECAPNCYASPRIAFDMTHEEFIDFFVKLREAPKYERYSITWRLRRRSTGRVVTLHFFTCEGLEAYVILSHMGRYAPQILCTIETGVLESPRGMINRFFTHADRARPLVWVRGFEPRLFYYRQWRRNAIDSAGVFSVRAMPFNHSWEVGFSYENQRRRDRHCFGFVTKELARTLRDAAWKPQFQNGLHAVTSDSIASGITTMGGNDLAFMSRRLVDRFAQGDSRIHAWESILAPSARHQSARDQVSKLQLFIERIGPPPDTRIHLAPYCMEDENAPYWEALDKLQYRTITYCPDLADYFELKDTTACLVEPTSQAPEFSAAIAPILPILNRVNVISIDDGRRFTDTTRLDAIEQILCEANSPWAVDASGPLFRLYSRSGSPLVDRPVVISSHVTSSYVKYFHRPLENSVELIGTFDNSITNATVLELMLSDRLPKDALVAFTGDGEESSQGALDLIAFLRNGGRLPKAVLVLDITDDSSYGSPCTLENYFANGSQGLPSDEQEFHNFLQQAFKRGVPSVHHDTASPDESWQYDEEGVHVVSLCIPSAPADINNIFDNWIHSANGVCIRADLLPAFGESLVRLASHLSGTAH